MSASAIADPMSNRFFRHILANGLIFIHDGGEWTAPDVDGIGTFWRSDTCVVVSCLPHSEGATSIEVGESDEVRHSPHKIFDDWLDTPSGKIRIEGVEIDEITSFAVPAARTRLIIWTDGHKCSEFVSIGVSLRQE